MKTITKTMIALALTSLIIAGLAVLNGCKKSEPAARPTSESSGNDMANMNMANHDAMASDADIQAAPNGQKLCPVMGGPIDPNVFVEYQGKKVYFCCEDCEAQFQEDPEKYIAKLPQFQE